MPKPTLFSMFYTHLAIAMSIGMAMVTDAAGAGVIVVVVVVVVVVNVMRWKSECRHTVVMPVVVAPAVTIFVVVVVLAANSRAQLVVTTLTPIQPTQHNDIIKTEPAFYFYLFSLC